MARDIKQRQRRTTVRKSKGASESGMVPVGTEERLTSLAQTIVLQQRKVDNANQAITNAMAEAEELLVKAKMNEFDVSGAGTHQMVKGKSNSSTSLDLSKIQKIISKADFMSILKIGVTDAKKLLTEKQFASVATITPGKIKEAAYKFLSAK